LSFLHFAKPAQVNGAVEVPAVLPQQPLRRADGPRARAAGGGPRGVVEADLAPGAHGELQACVHHGKRIAGLEGQFRARIVQANVPLSYGVADEHASAGGIKGQRIPSSGYDGVHGAGVPPGVPS